MHPRWMLLVVAAACSEPGVPAKARLFNGVTAGGAGGTVAGLVPGLVPAGDGMWAISPDQVRLRLTRLYFADTAGRRTDLIDLSDCTATYDRSAPSLSERLACDFEVPPGTYATVGVQFDREIEVLIDDPANGLYTDGVGIVTSPVAGGARFSRLTTNRDGFDGGFSAPLVVDVEPVEIGIVMSGQRTVSAMIGGGQVAYRDSSSILELYPNTGAPVTAEFYSSSGNGDSLHLGTAGFPTDLNVFYQDATTPAYAFINPGMQLDPCRGGGYSAWNTSPGHGDGRGGYLGLDGAGTLCWALPENDSYTTYHALYALPRVPAIGGSATLTCQTTTTAPPPSVGDTYASGCPPLAPTAATTMQLVAR